MGWFGYLDWGAILASVFAGLGTTLLLVAFGSAVGIEAADDGGGRDPDLEHRGRRGPSSRLCSGRSWARSSAAGTAVIQSGASAVYHALTSWGLVQVLGLWLAGNGIAGLLSGGLRSPDTARTGGSSERTAEQVADAVSWGGWALALGMALTLATAIARLVDRFPLPAYGRRDG